MSTPQEKNDAILQVLHREPKQKFTAADLQILRANADLLEGHDKKTDYFQFRMEIELIDAIRSLDEVSAKLIEKTNSLTKAILWLTVATVGLAAIQILITVFGHNK
jgi:hypothetical protein